MTRKNLRISWMNYPNFAILMDDHHGNRMKFMQTRLTIRQNVDLRVFVEESKKELLAEVKSWEKN